MSWLANAVRVVLRLPLGPVNRVALIFRPKQPFAEWINTCGPVQPVEDLRSRRGRPVTPGVNV